VTRNHAFDAGVCQFDKKGAQLNPGLVFFGGLVIGALSAMWGLHEVKSKSVIDRFFGVLLILNALACVIMGTVFAMQLMNAPS
jgi:hypothetical protein